MLISPAAVAAFLHNLEMCSKLEGPLHPPGQIVTRVTGGSSASSVNTSDPWQTGRVAQRYLVPIHSTMTKAALLRLKAEPR